MTEIDDFYTIEADFTGRKKQRIDWVFVGGIAIVFGVVAAIAIFYFVFNIPVNS